MYRNIVIVWVALFALVSAQDLQPPQPPVQSPQPPVQILAGEKLAVNDILSANGSTTPSNTTTTSTVTPVPTTTAKPTPAPTPGPIPKPEQWSGNVTQDNKTCINVEFEVKIEIKYNATNNTQFATGFTIPVNASVNSDLSYCSPNDTGLEAITISFAHEEHTSADLTLTFNKTDNNIWVQSIKLSFNLTEELFPQYNGSTDFGKTVVSESENVSLFKVADLHSYVCSAPQTAQLDSNDTGIVEVEIYFFNSRVEAYIKDSKKGSFDTAIDCKSSEIHDVVPIAVGAALAGLVVIVLIAYFIGRRRSRRLAYQSV